MKPKQLVGRLKASLCRKPKKPPLRYDIDCLVYSSQKSGTQTLKATLDRSGISASYIHRMANAGMPSCHGTFRSYLNQYRLLNNHKLDVISTFRLPLERYMSSFFQRYGHDVVGNGLVRGIDDTVIARLNVGKLQTIFLDELRQGSLMGRPDSLHELCGELGFEVTDLPFDTARGFGVFENELIRVHLFRFDLLFPDFAGLLANTLNVRVSPQIANVSEQKWYGQKFYEFKATLNVPPDLIKTVHEEKKDLIDVFYPGLFQEILNDQLVRYGAHR